MDPAEAANQPAKSQVRELTLLTPGIGMKIRCLWTEEMARKFQLELSRSLQPDQVISGFLSTIGMEVTFGPTPKQPQQRVSLP